MNILAMPSPFNKIRIEPGVSSEFPLDFFPPHKVKNRRAILWNDDTKEAIVINTETEDFLTVPIFEIKATAETPELAFLRLELKLEEIRIKTLRESWGTPKYQNDFFKKKTKIQLYRQYNIIAAPDVCVEVIRQEPLCMFDIVDSEFIAWTECGFAVLDTSYVKVDYNRRNLLDIREQSAILES